MLPPNQIQRSLLIESQYSIKKIFNFQEYIFDFNVVISKLQFVEPNKYHININSFYSTFKKLIHESSRRKQEERSSSIDELL